MDRTERFYKIDNLLKDRKVVSFAALQDSLGVSRATFKRDLEYMRNRLHAPIEYDRDANGYRFGKPKSGPRCELPGLWFSAAEIHALLTMLQLLGNLQPGLLDGQAEPLVERLRAILGRGDHSWEQVEKYGRAGDEHDARAEANEGLFIGYRLARTSLPLMGRASSGEPTGGTRTTVRFCERFEKDGRSRGLRAS